MRMLFQAISDHYALLFIRTFIALVLLVAGISKLSGRREFIEAVRNYRLLPENLAIFVGRWIPVLEAMIGISLLLGILVSLTTFAAAALFVLFGIAVAVNLLRGRRNISCGCFGPQQNHHLTWILVARNMIFAILAVLVGLDMLGSGDNVQLTAEEAVATMLVAATSLALWWLWSIILMLLRLDPSDGNP